MPRHGRRLFSLAIITVLGLAANALANDLADEAQLAFELGAQAYQQRDYRAALQQFLLSNRLVPNRNVVFNIACTYDELSLFPEAHRYYSEAIDGETDPAARSKIEAALARLSDKVAVLRIETDPPGAILYLDRKDLGPRGRSPRRLGVTPGDYRIIAELAGHKPAELSVLQVTAAEERAVRIELAPVTSTLVVLGPPGGIVRLGGANEGPRCRAPCSIQLPPGRHLVFVDSPGYRVRPVTVDLAPNTESAILPETDPQTGTLVIATDEPGAEVRIDGHTRGFTPTLVTLPVGSHAVSVSLSGFRESKATAFIAEGRETSLSFQLLPADEVMAASRISQRLEQAPGSVSIISRNELRAFAYPTIAEALRGQPGVYVWDDRSYVAVGIRSLGRLGSYGNRLLVLSDGHPMNDTWVGSSYVGYDAMSDLDDVERIELVRGPGSALYGTNAFSGVINLVPREREPGVSLGTSTNLDGVARARVRADSEIGSGGHLWSSFSAARSAGRTNDLGAGSPQVSGTPRRGDGFHSGTVHGSARLKALSAQWSVHVHDKRLTTGEHETDALDPRTRQRDTRAFLELRAEPVISNHMTLLIRAHANIYRFHGDYPRPPGQGGLEVDTYHGQWLGLEQRLILSPVNGVRITLGGEGQLHYQASQAAEDEAGVYLKDDHPFQVGALYVLADADLARNVRLSAGSRYDAYSTTGSSLNPRTALILTPYANGTLKILGGRAFRAPSLYELYYQDGGSTQVSSPNLDPEVVYTSEIEHTHRFSSMVVGTAAAYTSYVHGLVVSRGEGNEVAPLRYVNSTTPLFVLGGELGVRRDFRHGFMLGASYSLSHARFLDGSSARDILRLKHDANSRDVANAPRHLASLRGAAPVLSRKVLAATRLGLEGARFDRNESVDGAPQNRTHPAVVWDLILSGEDPRYGVEYAVGVYNAFDWRYDAPTSFEFRQTTITQSGRTFLASLEFSL